jgi:hypothetical protein
MFWMRVAISMTIVIATYINLSKPHGFSTLRIFAKEVVLRRSHILVFEPCCL